MLSYLVANYRVQVYPIVWGLVLFSLTNAVYTITRTRKYRMFEADIDVQPATPSARRVNVQGSPATSSPLRFISNMITPDTPESREHPDKKRDVWELAVWDPVPISLRLFCLFSPGHVLVYLIFLPLAPLDPRPSMTVFNTILIQILLSAQLLLFHSKFSQQSKDSAIIQKEVMHEYDAKFVHPMLHPIVRDAGTQISEDTDADGGDAVQVGTPTTLIRRSFKTHGNPHAGQDEMLASDTNVMSPRVFTPPARRSELFTPSASARGSGFRNSLPSGQLPMSASTSNIPFSSTPGSGFAGNMGTQTNSRSPLKKTYSMGNINTPQQPSPRNSREMAAFEQRRAQPSSPLKHSESRRSFASSGTEPASYANSSRLRQQQQHQQEQARPRW